MIYCQIFLKELFKTVLLLVAVAVISSLPFIGLNIAATILSFANHAYLNTTTYKIIANAALILLLANSFSNALIILYRNKKSRKWLKERLNSCCKRKKKEEEQGSPDVIVNIAREDPHAISKAQSGKYGSTDDK